MIIKNCNFNECVKLYCLIVDSALNDEDFGYLPDGKIVGVYDKLLKSYIPVYMCGFHENEAQVFCNEITSTLGLYKPIVTIVDSENC